MQPCPVYMFTTHSDYELFAQDYELFPFMSIPTFIDISLGLVTLLYIITSSVDAF